MSYLAERNSFYVLIEKFFEKNKTAAATGVYPFCPPPFRFTSA